MIEPDDSRGVNGIEDFDAERPHVLVLHPDLRSDRSVEERAPGDVAYFCDAVQSARGIPGLREISLDLSDMEDPGVELLHQTGRCAADCGFEFGAVVSSKQVEQWGVAAFSACREVDLRIDTARYPTLKLTPDFYHQVDRLQAESRVVSFQVLLDRDLIRRLKLPRLRRWLDRADFVTLVAPRGRAADFERAELSAFFEQLTPLWEKADRFFHLHVDRAIKPAFFPWNLLSVACPAADLELHLDADGRLFLCADAEAFAVLSHPGEMAAAVLTHLQQVNGPADLAAVRPFHRS